MFRSLEFFDMQRASFLVPAAIAVLLLLAGDASAQWPPYAAAEGTSQIERGPGFYFAIWKLLLLLIPLLLWARTTVWVAGDLEEFGPSIRQQPEVWNPVLVFTFLAAFVLVGLSIPIFLASYGLIVIAWAAPLIAYLSMRDGKVPEDRRVLTAAGMKRMVMSLVQGNKGPKVQTVAKQPWEMGPAVDLTAVGPLVGQNQSAMIEARQTPAYLSVKMLIADAILSRGEKIRLDYTAEAVTVRYMIDGVWHPATPNVHEKEPLTRALGDTMLVVMKRLAHLNPQDRRSQQKGKFQTGFQGMKLTTQIVTQGTPTGEAAMVTFVPILKTQRTLEELGMREKMRQQLKELMAQPQSLFVFCSLPGDGLTATWLASLKVADRLLKDFVTIENAHTGEPDLVENIEHNKFDPDQGETPLKLALKLKLRQPDIYLAPSIDSGDLLGTLCDQIEEESKSVIVSTRAREAVEALVRLLALKPDDPEKFISRVSGVLNQRLVRKLCVTCREAVPLTPEMAQRLRIPAGRVQNLYREKQPLPAGQEPPKGVPLICPDCKGIGYKGRTAIYELLVITDQLREVLRKKPQVEVLKQYAAKGGHPSLQEEGILLAAAGTTSLQELQRVLKPG